jgi:hypothetical protein
MNTYSQLTPDILLAASSPSNDFLLLVMVSAVRDFFGYGGPSSKGEKLAFESLSAIRDIGTYGIGACGTGTCGIEACGTGTCGIGTCVSGGDS